jgi:hypothetical protein
MNWSAVELDSNEMVFALTKANDLLMHSIT